MDNMQPTQEKKSNKTLLIIIAFLVVMIGAGAAIYFSTQDTNENANTTTNTKTNTTNSTAASNIAADPYASLKQYDGKVINISSADGKVKGQAVIAFQMSEAMPIQVVYFLKVTDTLPMSRANVGGDSYYYIANHAEAANVRTGQGTGLLNPVRCNKDQMPDLTALAKTRATDVATYTGCSSQYDLSVATDTFYQIYSDYYNNYTFSYDKIVGKDTLAVFDSAPFHTTNSTTGASTADNSQVISQSAVAAQYTLTYSNNN
ncbi:MAG: hypothetical protein V1668_02315 [Patescibacteria group bacterium]